MRFTCPIRFWIGLPNCNLLPGSAAPPDCAVPSMRPGRRRCVEPLHRQFLDIFENNCAPQIRIDGSQPHIGKAQSADVPDVKPVHR